MSAPDFQSSRVLHGSVPMLERWFELEGELRSDVFGIFELSDASTSSQPLRRAFVRSVWGYIDGALCSLIEMVSAADDPTNSKLDEQLPAYDHAGAAERTPELLQSTLQWCTSDRLTPGWTPDFGSRNWERLCVSHAVRNRMMRPQLVAHVLVSEDDFKASVDACIWFSEAMREIRSRALAVAAMRPVAA